MNKKLIAVAVAGVMAVPFAVQASITLGGDARVRYQSMEPDGGDNGARTTTRARLTLEAKDGDAAGVSYRGEIANVTHGGGGTTALETDWAYGYLNTGFVKISGGVMKANWGTGLIINDARPNRMQFSKAMGGITLALSFDKITESGMGMDDADNDKGQTVLFAKTKNFGLIYFDKYTGKNLNAGTEINSTTTDIFYSGEVAGIGINAEYATNGGDADGDTFGLIISKGIGKVSLAGLYVMTKDGGSVDTDYFDTTAAGDQYDATNLAMMGAAGGRALASTKGEDRSALGVIAGFDITSKMNTQLSIVSFGSSQNDLGINSDTDNVTLVDLIVTHKFGEKSKLMGYAFSASDVATGYGLNVETKF